jgi:RNA polymerase I-specific transcription initiation factor RRN3
MAAPSPHTSLPNREQKPNRPLLRRATVNGSGTVRTRDEAGLDLDFSTGSAPPSPSKKARTVTFNPVVDEKLFSQSKAMAGYAADLEAVRIEVKLALEEHIMGGNEEKYDMLKEIFGPVRRGTAKEGPSNEKIRTYLLALTTCVSLLGKNCSGLVRVVLECEWMGREEGFVKIYVHFLGNLASAQGSYVGMILSTLVGKFTSCKLHLFFFLR